MATASMPKIDDVLTLECDRPLRQNFLQLSRRHQAAGKRQSAEDDLATQYRHLECRDSRALAEIEFRRADQRHAKGAEGVAERRPLRHRGHLHHAERNTDRRANAQRDENPRVADCNVLDLALNTQLKDGPANREHHADFAGQNAAPRGRRRVHPLESQDEQRAGYEINESDECLTAKDRCHDFVGRLDLNIFNMRSVIKKPPTMLLVAAITARIPRMNASLLS